HRELAEDLCQETFIKAFRNWPTQGQLRNPVGWLYQIARNTAIDELRRHQRLRFVDLPDETILTGNTNNLDTAISDKEAVREALQQIPVLYRQALVLYVWADYSVKDIAAICNCSISAVKARLFRARAYFREAYVSGGRNETLRVSV
ncbi:MAG: RNA polymerase sigma factor, partial [Chloroflexota bacterium]